ncbi:MAG: ATP-dependent helicase [Desulfovibrio sp.]|jgi:DNA helicase-2/ATP-dependent DNA helicase PcrA|nr:ATP-dependent helicase [Desulfovibrio sp.]
MIDYAKALNPAQFEAATTLDGPVLVIAGAGSGKTRTIIYRLAQLVESGVPASSILLLTFTRKAATEMLDRARMLLSGVSLPDGDFSATQGGTFHAYAYSVLRVFPPEGYAPRLTIMDNSDVLAALQHCREALKAGKGDRSFPKNQSIQAHLSKSRNKELSLEAVLGREASHLLPHAGAMEEMGRAYAVYKREKNLLDYDDLLFLLEETLLSRPEVLSWCRARHSHLMVDEYQDTNPVQARLAALVAGLSPETVRALKSAGTLAGESPRLDRESSGNIMAVGDDAQSIYAFRGADVRNILRFPDLFPQTRLIRLEENYRSVQPILDLGNAILKHASEGFAKRLYTRRSGGLKPNLIRPISDRSQAALVAARLVELCRIYQPGEIAVLFRAGFHSYALEVHLNKLGLRFRKHGGIRYAEAAHIKDAVSFMRLILNPLDFTAFARMAGLCQGIGPKTCLKLHRILLAGDETALAAAAARYPDLSEDLAFISAMRLADDSPASLCSRVIEHYAPRLRLVYPDDYPRRLQGLEQIVQIASAYEDADLFLADLSLDDPLREEAEGDSLILSTIHSAKGLEWSAVLILDLVEDRFPSRHALIRPEDYEEERRLLYVACTRAREVLDLYVPSSLYDRNSGGTIPSVPSPFLRGMSPSLFSEWRENPTGGLTEKIRASLRREESLAPGKATLPPEEPEEGEPPVDLPDGPASPPGRLGFCRHRIFGRGKIVQFLPPDRYRVHFPGLGLKVVLAPYLILEQTP